MNEPGVYKIAGERDMNSPSTKRLTSNQLVQDGIQEVQGASPIAGENVQEDCLTRRISMQLGLRR